MWPILGGIGSTILGGLLGRSQNPGIDPRQLAALFGPQQLSADTQKLYALLAASPEWSQMMQGAALQGQRTANQTKANLEASGLGGSPYGAFLSAAGTGYPGALQRQGQADLFMKALQAAFEGLQSRQSLYGQSVLGRQNQPTWQRMIGASLLNAGSLGFGGLMGGKNNSNWNPGFGNWGGSGAF